MPLLHDTPDAMANPHGVVRDWKHGECEPVPGVTMPKLVVVERDYTAVGAQDDGARAAARDSSARPTKGVTYDVDGEVDYLLHKNGAVRGGAADGRPVAGARHPRLRGDPRPVRHHQRAPRHPGLPDPGEAHRHRCCTTSRPSTRASRSPSPTPRPRRCR